MNKALQCTALWAAVGCGLCIQATAAQPVVAQATLVIGHANILQADGKSMALARGSEVRVGDVIQTELGGHVHLRFLDGGRISVRPSSRLQIDSYGYSEGDVQASAIKFRLDEGVVRSITGEWGAAARERFRLNTPVAAIGVKGTDFVVKATADTTAASVFTGAISVAPLDGACSDGLGPCQDGKLLSEEMKGQMLQLARLQNSPSLVPAVDLMVASLPQQASQNVEPGKNAHVSPGLIAAADKPWLTETRVASAALGAIVTGDVTEGSANKTLSWGRYAWGQTLSGDSFSQQIDLAMLQGQEKLAGNGSYSLFRQMNEGKVAAYAPPSGMAQFKLENASASVIHSSGLEPVAITAATLGVNFDTSSFATRLDIQGPQLGNEVVQASGLINDQGVMKTVQGNVNLQGGLAADGLEAGYVFQKGVSTGLLQGITLWGR